MPGVIFWGVIGNALSTAHRLVMNYQMNETDPRSGLLSSGGLQFDTNETRSMAIKNVEIKVEGNILTIKVDLTKEFGPSASGKTIIIASTEGNVAVPDRDEMIGLNVYRKKPSG